MIETLASPATDTDFLHDLVARVLRAGASDAQVDSSANHSLNVEVRDGALQEVLRAENTGIRLTTYMGKRKASLGTNKFDRKALDEFVERVIGMTRLAAENPYCGLAPSELVVAPGDDRHLELCDAHEPSTLELEQMAKEVETAARAVPGVTATQVAAATWSIGEARCVTSGGLDRLSEGSHFSAGISVVAGTAGQREVAGTARSARWYSDLPPLAEIGREAGEEAVAKIGGRKIASRKAAILFDRRIAMSVLEPFFGAIGGESIARRTSFLLDALGEQIFPAGFTLTDDAFILRGHGSRACDAEGIAPKPRALVNDGVLTTWLVNCAVSRELGIPSTGHAGGASNVMVLPGDHSRDALMAEAGEGLLVTNLMGASLNPHTGDWSVGVSGQWFEKGSIAYPVSEVTIAGCLPELYRTLLWGSDLEIRGPANAPSLLVQEMTISGN